MIYGASMLDEDEYLQKSIDRLTEENRKLKALIDFKLGPRVCYECGEKLGVAPFSGCGGCGLIQHCWKCHPEGIE